MIKDIGGVFVRKNESMLNDIGKQLNTIVSDTSLNSKNYSELQLIYQSASEALRCHVDHGWVTDPIVDVAAQDTLIATSDMIAGVLGTIATLLVLLKIIAPANYQDDISAFILKLVGIEAVAGDCGGGKKRTPFGAITLVMALLRVYSTACKIVYFPGLCDILKCLKDAIQKIVNCLIDQDTDLRASYSAFSTNFKLTFL
ncbi:hypothetical protein BG000_008187 [Podila horticola]|nr:hypothetical protein BG000_008187 [Podila horticola]